MISCKKQIYTIISVFLFANFRDNKVFLRKKNGMGRQRLTESARQAWYILDKQIVFGKKPEKHASGYSIQGRT